MAILCVARSESRTVSSQFCLETILQRVTKVTDITIEGHRFHQLQHPGQMAGNSNDKICQWRSRAEFLHDDQWVRNTSAKIDHHSSVGKVYPYIVLFFVIIHICTQVRYCFLFVAVSVTFQTLAWRIYYVDYWLSRVVVWVRIRCGCLVRILWYGNSKSLLIVMDLLYSLLTGSA